MNKIGMQELASCPASEDRKAELNASFQSSEHQGRNGQDLRSMLSHETRLYDLQLITLTFTYTPDGITPEELQ